MWGRGEGVGRGGAGRVECQRGGELPTAVSLREKNASQEVKVKSLWCRYHLSSEHKQDLSSSGAYQTERRGWLSLKQLSKNGSRGASPCIGSLGEKHVSNPRCGGRKESRTGPWGKGRSRRETWTEPIDRKHSKKAEIMPGRITTSPGTSSWILLP